MSLEDLRTRTILNEHGLDPTSRFRVTIPLPDALNAFIQEQEERNGGSLPPWAQDALRVGSILLGGGAYGERGLQFMCVGAPLPGTQVALEEFQVNGHTLNFATGIERDVATFTFMVSGDFYEKDLFDKWMNFIVDERTRKASYYDEYTTDIRIQALNTRDETVYTLNMIDAFPVTVDTYELDRGARDTFQLLSVSFHLKYLTNNELPEDESFGFPGNVGGLLDGLANGNLEQAAYSARMLAVQAQRGNFTGEAAALYGRINDIVEQSIGFSAVESDKMLGNLSNMVNQATGISEGDRTLLNQILGF